MGIVQVFDDVLMPLLVDFEDYGFDGWIALHEDAY